MTLGAYADDFPQLLAVLPHAVRRARAVHLRAGPDHVPAAPVDALGALGGKPGGVLGSTDALPEDHWTGRTGFVHHAVMQDFPDLSGHEVYACGAPIVVESAQRDFVARCGLPADAFFADAFTSEADKHDPAKT